MTIQNFHPEIPLPGYRYKHGDRPLDGYTIVRAAGRGGFGEVYSATSDSGREVALKVVHTFEQMELRGISQCMNLKSPHLVSIFDVRTGSDGQPIVIMEFVSGPSLRELLDEAPSGLGTQKAAFFLREIGKGLTYLHDCGIVHRDLKPANIFYENGYVKIGDYGLSKAISTSHYSAQTMTVGTVHYMAPEIGAGRYDQSIDIYALGVLLYEMLTGHPPFFGASTAEVLMKHLGTTVDVTGIPEPFAAVILKAMAKNPADRYETTQQMVEAVFGAEHIRQSVSCFTPDHLTMVAGRVANRAAFGMPGRPMSSRAYDVAATEPDAAHEPLTWADRMGARLGRLSERIAGIGDSLGALITGGRQAIPLSSGSVPGEDSISRGHRLLLALIALISVSVVAGIFVSGSSEFQPPHVAMFSLLCIAGAAYGATWSARKLLPSIQNEGWLVRQLATGGIAAILAIVVSLPAWGPVGRGMRQIGESLGAIAISLLLIDWQKRTRPDRRERISLGGVINCAVVALVIGLMLDTHVPLVVVVLCGISTVTQIASPWTPGVLTTSKSFPQVAVPPLRQSNPAPGAQEQAEQIHSSIKENGMAVTRVNLGPLSIFSSAPATRWPRDRAGGGIIGTVVRLPLVLVAIALLLGALIAGTALAFDVPGWMASGRLDPSVVRDLRENFGTTEWPRLFRVLMGSTMFVGGILGAGLLMLMRRRRGGIHMTRVLMGVILLLWTPFILVGRNLVWHPAARLPVNDWVAVVDEFMVSVTSATILASACAIVGALVLVLWPARASSRTVPAMESQSMSAAGTT
jgi:hypothetical protein